MPYDTYDEMLGTAPPPSGPVGPYSAPLGVAGPPQVDTSAQMSYGPPPVEPAAQMSYGPPQAASPVASYQPPMVSMPTDVPTSVQAPPTQRPMLAYARGDGPLRPPSAAPPSAPTGAPTGAPMVRPSALQQKQAELAGAQGRIGATFDAERANVADAASTADQIAGRIQGAHMGAAQVEADHAATIEAIQKKSQDQIAQRQAQMADYQRYIDENPVDPTKAFPQSTGGQIAFAIAAALGGVGAALQGPGAKNQALTVLDGAIDRTVHAQMARLQTAQNSRDAKAAEVRELRAQFGDDVSTANALKMQKLSSVQQMLEAYKVEGLSNEQKLNLNNLQLDLQRKKEALGADILQSQITDIQKRQAAAAAGAAQARKEALDLAKWKAEYELKAHAAETERVKAGGEAKKTAIATGEAPDPKFYVSSLGAVAPNQAAYDAATKATAAVSAIQSNIREARAILRREGVYAHIDESQAAKALEQLQMHTMENIAVAHQMGALSDKDFDAAKTLSGGGFRDWINTDSSLQHASEMYGRSLKKIAGAYSLTPARESFDEGGRRSVDYTGEPSMSSQVNMLETQRPIGK